MMYLTRLGPKIAKASRPKYLLARRETHGASARGKRVTTQAKPIFDMIVGVGQIGTFYLGSMFG